MTAINEFTKQMSWLSWIAYGSSTERAVLSQQIEDALWVKLDTPAFQITSVEEVTGFHAEVWKLNDDIVIAIRGTDEPYDWWTGNAWLAAGVYAPQWESMNTYFERVLNAIQENPALAGCNIISTGHSLGGGLAAAAKMSFGLDACIVFDPGPFYNMVKRDDFIPRTGLSDAFEEALQVGSSHEDYEAAVAARTALLSARESNLTSISLAGDPLLTAAWLLPFVEAFPNAEPPIDIGWSNSEESLRRHDISLLSLAMDESYASLLRDSSTARDIVLQGYFGSETPHDVIHRIDDYLSKTEHRGWLIDSVRSIMALDYGPGVERFLVEMLFQAGHVGSSAPILTENIDGSSYLDVQDVAAASGWKDFYGVSYGVGGLNSYFHSVLTHALTVGEYIDESPAFQRANAILGRGAHENPTATFDLPWRFVGVSPGAGGVSDYGALPGGAIHIGARDDETIRGSSYGDFILLAGGSVYEAGAGSDVVVGINPGEAGSTVSYVHSTSGVSIDLSSISPQSGGYAEGDVLVGIRNVIGSIHSDHLRGDASINVLYGGDGDDFFYIEGDGSNADGDTFDGGTGIDTVDLSAAGERPLIAGAAAYMYVVDLGLGYVSGGGNFWVKLESIDKVVASEFADLIYGNDQDNVLYGGGGDDRLYGGEGNDVLRGGAGRDLLFGGAGNDYLYVGLDGDKVWGDDGDDIFVIDELIDPLTSPWGGATIFGGSGHDVLYLSHGQLTASDLMQLWEGGRIASIGLQTYGIEEIRIGWLPPSSGSKEWTASADSITIVLDDLTSDLFTGADLFEHLAGVYTPLNSAWESISVASLEEGATGVVFRAALPDHIFGTPKTVTSSTFYVDSLPITLDGVIVGREIVFSTGSPFVGDGHMNWAASGRANVEWEYQNSYWVDGTLVVDTVTVNSNLAFQFGIEKVYAAGPTEITADDFYVTTHRSQLQFDAAVDRFEAFRPVRYELIDDREGAFRIDEVTGIVTCVRPALFPAAADFTITVKATDGVTTLLKDIEIRMDREIETAPEIHAFAYTGEILPVAGSGLGQWAVWDNGDWAYGTSNHTVTFDLIGSINPEPLVGLFAGSWWGVVLARDPTPDEIGVPLEVLMTVTDETGQSAQETISFTIIPEYHEVFGTSGSDQMVGDPNVYRKQILYGLEGDDYLWSMGPDWILNGGEGDDTLIAQGHGTTMIGGPGADTLYFAQGGSSVAAYHSISDSPLSSYDAGSGLWPSQPMDWLVNFDDTSAIDLSALGTIVWEDAAAIPEGALLARMQTDEYDRPSLLLIDEDGDGLYDFGLQFAHVQATQSISFIGLSDWVFG